MRTVLFSLAILAILICGCEHKASVLVVDYSDSLEQAIAHVHIDEADPRITSDAFHKGEMEVGKKKFLTRTYTFSHKRSAESVRAEMQADGYRAATAYELLAYANAFPRETNDNLVALGSVWAVGQKELNVVTVSLKSSGRILSLFNCRLQSSLFEPDGLFSVNSWFLALKDAPDTSEESAKSNR